MGKNDSFATGSGSVGPAGPPLNPRNQDRSSRVSAAEPRRENFHRAAMSQAEALGARLTISPSMKIPGPPEAAATQASGRIVRSKPGRSVGGFQEGRYSTQVGPMPTIV